MAGINNEGSRGLRSLLIATLLASWLAFCFRPVFHDFRGRWRYQRRRYTCTTRVICRGGYESGECPFGRNIILNDDIGGARGGARNRAPPAPPLPPPTYERVCNARGNENRVWCGCVENVWAAVRTFHAFAAFPRCAPRNEIGRIFFNLSMGEWNLCSPSIFTRLEKLLLGIVISPFWIERSKLDETEDNLLLIFSEIWKNFEKLLFGDYLIFDWTKWFWMKWRLQSVVNLGDVVAFEFLSEIRKWFFEDNNLWFLIPSWMEQMCSDIGNIKIRLWTFQRFERLFAIMIFNFGLNEMIWIKWRLIDIISCVQQAFWYRKY